MKRLCMIITLAALALTLLCLSAQADEFLNISCITDGTAIESGAIYAFEATISNNLELSDPAPRLIRSCVQYPTDTSQYYTSTTAYFYDDDQNWLSGPSENYQFQVNVVSGMTDGGNQGYTIRNVATGKYLSLTQALQPANLSPGVYGNWQIDGGTHIGGILYPTFPFVCYTDGETLWYWDAGNQYFYTYYTTPGGENALGGTWYHRYNYADPEAKLLCVVQNDVLMWINWLGMFSYGGTNDFPYTYALWGNDPSYWIPAGRNSKMILEAFSANDEPDPEGYWKDRGVDAFRDPAYSYGLRMGWSRSFIAQRGLSFAFLGAYAADNSMASRFNPPIASMTQQAERSRLTIYKMMPDRQGSGTASDPYKITNSAEWARFVNDVNAGRTSNVYYTLTTDLTVTAPVGSTEHPFQGYFEGGNHTVTLSISDTANTGTALFREISGATIRNLNIVGSVTGGCHAASLVGLCRGSGNLIENCNISASVTIPNNVTSRYLGGVVGHATTSDLTIRNTAFTGTLTNGSEWCGGLIGWTDAATLTLRNCFFGGNYTGASSRFNPVAVRSSNANVTVDAEDVYFTQAGGVYSQPNLIVCGTQVSTTIPENTLYVHINPVNGETYYCAVSGTISADTVYEARVRVSGEVTLSTDAGCTLTCSSGITVPAGAALTIDGSGTLIADASSYDNAAGIGGSDADGQRSSGTIIINGCTVTATGGTYGAGIGGGMYGWGSEITINGGTVTATGGLRGAGIGGGGNYNWAGGYGKAGTITINGGVVTATGNSTGAGIGGGGGATSPTSSIYGGYAESIVIRGGQVTASSPMGAAIGPGYRGTAMSVTLGWTDESDFISASSIVADTYTLEIPLHYHLNGEDTGEATADNLPDKPAAAILRPWPVLAFSGEGSADAPYLIQSSDDWDLLCALVRYDRAVPGTCFELTGPITVSTMLGSDGHPFSGTFDGGGNTLTLSLSDSGTATAPFRSISGAVIRNLKTAGTVSGGMHCSGLVGGVAGSGCSLLACEVAAGITTSGTHCGGIVGHGGTWPVTITECVFSGSISGVAHAGTIWGWSDAGGPTLTRCLDLSDSTWPIGLGSGTPTIVSTFYTCADKTAGTSRVWSNRGQLAYTVIAEEDVSIALCSGEAVARQNTIYAGSGQPISFTVWLGEQISFLPAIFVNSEPAQKLWPDADGVCTLTVTGDTCIGVVPEVAFDSADIELPNDLTSIEAQAFAGTAVYAVEIPSGCTFIGDRAFADCLSLTRVRIPADCALGEQVFANCRFPVYLYGPAGGTAEAYCQDPDNDTCVFIAEEAE